ncbi:MAG TPA: hypothetical protein VEQ87_15535 [Burkholderiales bacterium]|nr:hypothetical protein [Burkholderiales bacterium]
MRIPQKRLALVVLAALSFVCPAIERAVTGQVELLSNFGLAEIALSLVALFWWYHLDKADHHYRSGTLMNSGMLLLAAVAVPIYLIRSRGWKRGAIAVAVAAVYLAGTFVLSDLGERLGAALTS